VSEYFTLLQRLRDGCEYCGENTFLAYYIVLTFYNASCTRKAVLRGSRLKNKIIS